MRDLESDCEGSARLNFCEDLADKTIRSELTRPAFRDDSRDACRMSLNPHPIRLQKIASQWPFGRYPSCGVKLNDPPNKKLISRMDPRKGQLCHSTASMYLL